MASRPLRVVFEQSRSRGGVAAAWVPISDDLRDMPAYLLIRDTLDLLRAATVDAHGLDLMPRPDSAYWLARPGIHTAAVRAPNGYWAMEMRPWDSERLEVVGDIGAAVLVYGDGRHLRRWAQRRLGRAIKAGRPVTVRPRALDTGRATG